MYSIGLASTSNPVKILSPIPRQRALLRTSAALDSHLAGLCFYTDVCRLDQLRLVLPPPVDRPLDPLLRVLKFPFRGAHVSRVTSWVGEETGFPGVVGIRLREDEGLGVLRGRDAKGSTISCAIS